jgi:predicted Zn-dependent protease
VKRSPGWTRWALVGVAALVVALAAPQLWAWYHLRAARAALERYDNAAARGHLRQCLRVWPNSLPARLLAARAARRDGAYEEADEHLDRCRPPGREPPPEARLERMLVRAAAGDLEAVEEPLLARAGKDPAAAPLIWEALAEGYTRMYRILEAAACLDRWLYFQPDDVQALVLRGKVWQQARAVQKAVPDYARAVELDPGRDDARRSLAFALLDLGRVDEAFTHLEYLLRKQPDDPELRVRLAHCHKERGEFDRARELLDGVLAGHPEHGAALRERGETELRAGQAKQAGDWLRRAAAAQPNEYPTQWLLYEWLRQHGTDAEARAQLERAQQLKDRRDRMVEITTHLMPMRPHDAALHYEMGTLLLALGHDALGERWLASALHEQPDYGPAHAALADYYERRGDTVKAAGHRKQARAAPAAGPPPAP